MPSFESRLGEKPPTALVATRYLPSLDKAVWEKSDQVSDVNVDDQQPLPGPLQLAIRRSRLSVEILKRPSDNATKYDLFQRLDALHQGRISLEARCKLINEILDGNGGRFGYVNPSLIDTKSNLNTDVIKDICIICNIDSSHFESQRTLIDVLVLKRRNAIAHGQQEYIHVDEIDSLVNNVLALMDHFRSLLENKVYLKQYAA